MHEFLKVTIQFITYFLNSTVEKTYHEKSRMLLMKWQFYDLENCNSLYWKHARECPPAHKGA